jgi:hypothetical protein
LPEFSFEIDQFDDRHNDALSDAIPMTGIETS